MAERYPNPETAWHAEHGNAPVDLKEVTERIGPLSVAVQPLSGGLANKTIRLGDDRVMRLYTRDRTALPKEAVLLSRQWATFRTPKILDSGEDYLVLSYVPHRPLQNSQRHGAAVGEALAEIHQEQTDMSGLFDDRFQIAEPFPDFMASMMGYVATLSFAATDTVIRDRLPEAMAQWSPALAPFCTNPVRLHGDFKPSNLHWIDDDRLLVLDWEFTYAGPALMDIAQLARWGMPQPFRSAFESAYRSNGGVLPQNWTDIAERLDLANLGGLLANSVPGSARHADLLRRIEATLAEI